MLGMDSKLGRQRNRKMKSRSYCIQRLFLFSLVFSVSRTAVAESVIGPDQSEAMASLVDKMIHGYVPSIKEIPAWTIDAPEQAKSDVLRTEDLANWWILHSRYLISSQTGDLDQISQCWSNAASLFRSSSTTDPNQIAHAIILTQTELQVKWNSPSHEADRIALLQLGINDIRRLSSQLSTLTISWTEQLGGALGYFSKAAFMLMPADSSLEVLEHIEQLLDQAPINEYETSDSLRLGTLLDIARAHASQSDIAASSESAQYAVSEYWHARERSEITHGLLLGLDLMYPDCSQSQCNHIYDQQLDLLSLHPTFNSEDWHIGYLHQAQSNQVRDWPTAIKALDELYLAGSKANSPYGDYPCSAYFTYSGVMLNAAVPDLDTDLVSQICTSPNISLY